MPRRGEYREFLPKTKKRGTTATIGMVQVRITSTVKVYLTFISIRIAFSCKSKIINEMMIIYLFRNLLVPFDQTTKA